MTVRPKSRWAMTQPSFGYYVSCATSFVGLVLLVIAMGAMIRGHYGLDPLDAIDQDGVYALIFIWLLQYVMRLCFVEARLSVSMRNAIRTVLRCVAAAGLLLAAIAAVLLCVTPASQRLFYEVSFTVLGSLCQIGTVMWLVRYSGEPDARRRTTPEATER